jgi:hypothetical protein
VRPTEAHALVTGDAGDQASRGEGRKVVRGDEDQGCVEIPDVVGGSELRAVATLEKDPLPDPAIDPAQMRRVDR